MSGTLCGVTTIRAYNAEQEFADKFDSFQNSHSAVSWSQIVAVRWFGMAIQLLGFIYSLVVIATFILLQSGRKTYCSKTYCYKCTYILTRFS